MGLSSHEMCLEHNPYQHSSTIMWVIFRNQEDFSLCCSVQLSLNFVFDHPAQERLLLLVHLWHSFITI